MIDRVIVVVMDSVGIGELPDAAEYGDSGSNTLGNIYKSIEGFSLPNLERLGLGNIEGTSYIPAHNYPEGCFGRAAEMSKGKDTTTGHWEIMGVIMDKAFPIYPNGFPREIIGRFEEEIGRKVLGNKPASGTVIIEELGEKHLKTGYPIVYTSADSVFQIAAHEEVIPLEELYEMCKKARLILTGEHQVARVIARPFTGQPGSFVRTANRKDFSVEPPEKTLLDLAKDQGYDVIGIGKIVDIFSGRGITEWVHTEDNWDGIERTVEYVKGSSRGIIFTNLVDFDMKYGHRNNLTGYADALREFDRGLRDLMDSLKAGDVLIITADHGCDPTTPSTDHSREYVPILVWGRQVKKGINIGTRKTFSDIGATIADMLGINGFDKGNSFKKLVI